MLIDDNLLELNIFSELPFLYKLKLFFSTYCYKAFLNYLVNEVWVTNKRLLENVKEEININKINLKILTLSQYPIVSSTKIFKIAYLGTSSHTQELRWLKPLFEKIQFERNDCVIEIYVNQKWRKYFRSIPRIKMIHPMEWETLYLDTLIGQVDIVLNPSLASKFNKFRSPVKYFDTTRLGAVGIYSNIEPFKNFINDNNDGILLDNNIDLWCEKIYFLLDDSKERKRLLQNAIKNLNNKSAKNL